MKLSQELIRFVGKPVVIWFNPVGDTIEGKLESVFDDGILLIRDGSWPVRIIPFGSIMQIAVPQ